jgi:UbiD family decarboxylase
MQADLRSFLGQLESRGLLLRLSKPADPRREVGELMLQADRRRQAVLFERLVDSPLSCVANIAGTREMLGLALGVDARDVLPTFIERSRQRLEPRLVSSAPVQADVRVGDEADLRRLPLVVHSEKDAAPYVTAGLVIAKDPETGIRNVSFNRMMLRSGREAGVRMMPPQHLGRIYEKSAAAKRPLPVAVAIGNHPIDLLAGATSIPFGDDELALAGALRGEPLEIVKCRTVDLEVPAHAEIVLEGEVLPGVAEPEGPYGDFMQFYIPVMRNQVFRLRAITSRRDPIYQTMHAGVSEDMTLLAVSREAALFEAAVGCGADVRQVSLTPTILAGAISLRKRSEEEPAAVLSAAFARYPWLKLCVIVDEDVDVFDVSDVWWAVASRARLDTGVLRLTGTAGFPRDPYRLHTAKLGVDATIPLGSWEEHERKRAPGHGRIRIDDFL